MKKFVLHPICLLAVLVFLSSCGGGGGAPATAESPTDPTTPTIPTTPPTETPALFVGEIQSIDRTGTTRLVVNGVELLATDGTPVKFEPDEAGNLEALNVGMVVRVDGVIFDDRATGRADRIQREDLLEGPIVSVTETLG